MIVEKFFAFTVTWEPVTIYDNGSKVLIDLLNYDLQLLDAYG